MKHLVVMNKLEVPKVDMEKVECSTIKIGVAWPQVIYSNTEITVLAPSETVSAKIAVKMAMFMQKQMQDLADYYEDTVKECYAEYDRHKAEMYKV